MSARILIIEDNPENLELMRYLLKSLGHSPITAVDGEEGLELARRETPDLILCDIDMPKLDGYGVARYLKEHPALKAIPVVAVTALAMVGDREKILSVGFDGYISKPIEPSELLDKVQPFINFALHTLAPGISPAAPSRYTSKVYARILVVDDSAVNIEVMRGILEPSGYEVVGVLNSEAALDALKDSLPDLIMSDIHMPEENGFEFLERLKAKPELSHVPVILISSTASGERERALAAALGAEKLILRPIEPERLLAEVEALLPVRKTS